MKKDLFTAVVNLFKKVTISLVALIFSLGLLAACEEKGPLEKAGEKADKAVEEVQDDVEEAVEETTKDLEE
jgi:predicted small lipoprotein YifL